MPRKTCTGPGSDESTNRLGQGSDRGWIWEQPTIVPGCTVAVGSGQQPERMQMALAQMLLEARAVGPRG